MRGAVDRHYSIAIDNIKLIKLILRIKNITLIFNRVKEAGNRPFCVGVNPTLDTATVS